MLNKLESLSSLDLKVPGRTRTQLIHQLPTTAYDHQLRIRTPGLTYDAERVQLVGNVDVVTMNYPIGY